MLNIILLGAPGAGKGTQAQFISNHFNIPQISTGDILRAAIELEEYRNLKEIMTSGGLVPDDVVIKLVKARLSFADCSQGYLLDGFPRTLKQAQSLKDSGVKINYVIEIDVPQSQIVARISGRRVHMASGRTYHIINNPPRIADIDDITNEPLIHRPDDNEVVIKKRLDLYFIQTLPLTSYYANDLDVKYVKIDGTQEIQVIRQQINLVFDKFN